MKKPSKTLLILGAICIAVLLLAVSRLGQTKDLSRTEELPYRPTDFSPEKSDRSAEPIVSNDAQGKRPHRICQTIKQLQELGYQITADRIGRSSAEGNVTIRSPEGDFEYTCDDFTISADGLTLTLQGRLTMDFAGHTSTSIDEHALIRVRIDGSLVEQPGVWRRKKNPIMSDAQTE
jgi:hypothetical protein